MTGARMTVLTNALAPERVLLAQTLAQYVLRGKLTVELQCEGVASAQFLLG